MAKVTWASEVHGIPRARTRDTPAHIEPAPTAAQQPTGEGADWVWRHRRELVVPVVIAGLAGVSTWGHLLAPELAWAPLPLGLAVVGAAAVVPLPKRERTYALGWAVPAASWTTASWAVGIVDPIALAGLMLGGGAAVLHWLQLQSPRSRIEVVGGSPWPWHWEAWQFGRQARRELGHVVAVWPWIAERCGIRGAALRRLVADIDEGASVHVDLARGHTGADIRADRLHSALRIPVAVVTPDPARPWQIVLEQILPADDEVEVSASAAGVAPEPARPEPVDQLEERLARLRAALQGADGPLSIRKLAALTGLEPTWVWRTGLQELLRLGEASKGERGWTWNA